jgi:glucose-fructose oxidoreductase
MRALLSTSYAERIGLAVLCARTIEGTTKRLLDEGTIGQVLEVHDYDGNRGPLWHTADKKDCTAEDVQREKPGSWFYKQDRGGGSLLDYLGYGTTLGTC